MLRLYNKLRKFRKYILFFFDFVLWNLSFYFAYTINNDDFLIRGKEAEFISNLCIVNVCFFIVVWSFRLYDKIWRYADIEDFFYAGVASITSNVLFWCMSVLLINNLGNRVYIFTMLMSTFLMFMFRLIYRLNKILDKKNVSDTPKKRTLIVGAGDASVLILREMSKSVDNEYLPICIVDDDREKVGRQIMGVKVAGSTYEIPDLCEKMNIDVILFALLSIPVREKKRILDICAKTYLEVKIVPNIYDTMTSNKSVTNGIRRVEVEDLLGREPVIFDPEKYGQYIINKKVLVTGGGGSIGSELCRQISSLNPKNLVILDIYENSAYDIQQELRRTFGNRVNFQVEIASIRDRAKLEKVFKKNNFDVIFHAAAHKHVPLMETNPEEAVKNNVFGTLNLVELADKYKVKRFVQISTDKAVNPTNIMGATKRICEMIVQSMDKVSSTEFVAVRFGNVLGSNGSVIPLFKEQIKAGGPVTVTHPDVIRYFMTIPEAVSLVLTAGGLAKGGEIFVLDMGDPVRIKDLAENLIRLSGFTPNQDIEIKYTGLRPGEKLYEELLLDEEGITKTDSKKIYIGKPIELDVQEFSKKLEELKAVAKNNDNDGIERLVSEIVPTFKHAYNRGGKSNYEMDRSK